MKRWTAEQIATLREIYPIKGLSYCAEHMGLRRGQVRAKASRLGIKQDRESGFFREWQSRARTSKIGKKRPGQADVIRANHAAGKMKITEKMKIDISIRTKERLAKFGHPRGALGLKHSSDTKKIISEKSKSMWTRKTEEQLDAHSLMAAINGRKTTMNRLNASWKAGWREFGGQKVYYRSKWEANYGRYLQWLKDVGQIAGWEHEPKTFWFDGIKRGCLSYLPDFRVTELNGDCVYHEVKGWMDDRSITKIKRMKKYHPDTKLIVIDAACYRALERKMKPIIREWE